MAPGKGKGKKGKMKRVSGGRKGEMEGSCATPETEVWLLHCLQYRYDTIVFYTRLTCSFSF